MYEVGRGFKVLTEVKMVGVLRWDTPVHTAAAVVTLVPDAALLGVGCVQDMRDAQLTQPISVLSDGSERYVTHNQPLTFFYMLADE